MHDLFDTGSEPGASSVDYSAKDIEVLEGLEPVRRRPGMFIAAPMSGAPSSGRRASRQFDGRGGGRPRGLDRAQLDAEGGVTVRDNGRGIPTDPHPKFPGKIALEVIPDHAAFRRQVLQQGLRHRRRAPCVGISVVNALAEDLVVEVARNKTLWRQTYAKGTPQSELEVVGSAANRRGTLVTFKPDPEIFGKSLRFKPELLHRMARSKAYLFRGVEIRWQCDPSLLSKEGGVPEKEVFHFPKGLEDFLRPTLKDRVCVTEVAFSGRPSLAMARAGSNGRSPGRRMRSPMPASTATPCRHPRAVRTSRR